MKTSHRILPLVCIALCGILLIGCGSGAGKNKTNSSGMVKIGYIEGNSLITSIGDQLVVLRK
jgi:hypothetical protein